MAAFDDTNCTDYFQTGIFVYDTAVSTGTITLRMLLPRSLYLEPLPPCLPARWRWFHGVGRAAFRCRDSGIGVKSATCGARRTPHRPQEPVAAQVRAREKRRAYLHAAQRSEYPLT